MYVHYLFFRLKIIINKYNQYNQHTLTGYKEKWIKCASKLFAIEHLGYDDINNGITSQNAHQARPGQEKNEKEMVNKGMPVNAQIKRGKGRNYAQNILNDANNVIRTKRDSKLISPTMDFESKYTEIKDKLSEKEKRGCRGVERKIKKNCASETKYSCVRLANALGERRRKMAEISGVLPGKLLWEYHMRCGNFMGLGCGIL